MCSSEYLSFEVIDAHVRDHVFARPTLASPIPSAFSHVEAVEFSENESRDERRSWPLTDMLAAPACEGQCLHMQRRTYNATVTQLADHEPQSGADGGRRPPGVCDRQIERPRHQGGHAGVGKLMLGQVLSTARSTGSNARPVADRLQ